MNSPSSNSLTVQHSQTSSIRCCVSSSTTTSSLHKSANSNSSISSTSTLTMQSKSPTKVEETHVTSVYPDTPDSAHKASHKHSPPAALSLNNYKTKCQTPCHCKCTPKDFEKTTISPDEVLHERVKILKNVNEVNANTGSPKLNGHHITTHELRTSRCDSNKCDSNDNNNIEDWSLMLIGLAQINPAASLVHLDPFEAVPTISVVPPTPDALNSNNNRQPMSLNWSDSNRLQLGMINEDNGPDNEEYSPDNSPEDEVAEPPYRALNTGMKRYGTMSSLERVPSDETDKTYNSSEEDSENGMSISQFHYVNLSIIHISSNSSDIKIVTKEVYDDNAQTFMNWTARAGSFIEESRAFIDRYLGRGTTADEEEHKEDVDAEEDIVEGETSVTSGEEVWGTPTSGGENDDLQIFGSIEQTHSVTIIQTIQ